MRPALALSDALCGCAVTGVQTKRGRRQQSAEIRHPANLEDEEALRRLYLVCVL